VPFR